MRKKAEAGAERRKKLWIISELYYPEETSTGYYLTKIAEGLADDFRVSVICGQPNYSGRGQRAPVRETRRGVEIFRARATTLDKNVIPFRLLNMLTLGGSIFFKALFKFRRRDQILVVTTPPVLPWIIALAARLRGAEYVPLIHDNYPEILIAAGKTRADSPLVGVLQFINRRLYRHAAKIIVVGRDMRELIERKIAGNKVSIVYIPNWAELEMLNPQPRLENQLLRELGLAEKFVFLYAGNMGHPNDLESLVACAGLLAENSPVHFIFLGTGVKRKWLEREIATKKLVNITLLDPRPRSEQEIFLNACDVAVVSLVKLMKGVSMPSRTYNIMAVGKPLLALTEENSELAQVIREEKCGWIVEPDAPRKLYDLVEKISRQPDQLAEFGYNARMAAERKYSLTTAIVNYRKSLDTLSNNASDNE